jgi:putative oxidoreductase
MKIVSLVSRYLLGLMFAVFGLNGFLHFIPGAPEPGTLASQFFTVMTTSHYMLVVCAVQLVAGILLLWGRYVPLALAILAPVLVNILTFHITMNPEGIAPALVTVVLWVLVYRPVRSSFAGLWQSRPVSDPM